jgi:hypothetical protein
MGKRLASRMNEEASMDAQEQLIGVNTRERAPGGEVPRLLLSAVAGGLVGFLFLGEFAFRTFVPLLILLVVLAVASLIASVRGNPRPSSLAVFLVAAMIFPLMIDGPAAELPRCTDVPAGVACFAGSRDRQTPFVLEVLVVAIAGAALAVRIREFAAANRS